VHLILCYLFSGYLLLLIGRALLSWFPLSPGSPVVPVAHFLFTVTEPVLAPVRQFIPPVGGLDLSFLVVLIALQIVKVAVGCGGGII